MLRSASLLFAALLLVALDSPGQKQPSPVADAQVKKAIIAESIASYPGNCPCPYNTARNGSRCGKSSAYSRPGGYSPTCYESDVTPAMVAAWLGKRSVKGAPKQPR